MGRVIELADGGAVIAYEYEDLMRYHGPGSPAGVAIAFKVLERALPLLSPDAPCERRALRIATAFGGPGARDAFEMATRAVSEGRYEVEAALRRRERGPALERFVFRLAHGTAAVNAILREGYVTDEFARLAFARARDPAEEARLTVLKAELAGRVLAAAAADVVAVDDS
jgi:hypothetical protein